MMSRTPEPDVEKLITITALAQAWSCTPSEVLGEDCFYALNAPIVMTFLNKKAIADMERKNATRG